MTIQHGVHGLEDPWDAGVLVGEISDAGSLGIAFSVFSFLVPRYLDDTVSSQKSKDLGLPTTFRFRALIGIVKGSYFASYWLVAATALSLTGIDTKTSTNSILGGAFPTVPKPSTQEELDGRNESVAEAYTKAGFLVGFPLAYALFRDGWSVSSLHRTIPHLLPLQRLPLFVGFACISAEVLDVLSSANFRSQRRAE